MYVKMQTSSATLLQMRAQRILKNVERLKNEKGVLPLTQYNKRLESLREDANEIKNILSEVRNDKIIMIESE